MIATNVTCTYICLYKYFLHEAHFETHKKHIKHDKMSHLIHRNQNTKWISYDITWCRTAWTSFISDLHGYCMWLFVVSHSYLDNPTLKPGQLDVTRSSMHTEPVLHPLLLLFLVSIFYVIFFVDESKSYFKWKDISGTEMTNKTEKAKKQRMIALGPQTLLLHSCLCHHKSGEVNFSSCEWNVIYRQLCKGKPWSWRRALSLLPRLMIAFDRGMATVLFTTILIPLALIPMPIFTQ